ncbi:MAG TPA: SdiA-regulated domain-containing protein [Rhodothermales bacterium]|nr:SdiA-regulated domain-containing protein [Rhodothermales bacterium]
MTASCRQAPEGASLESSGTPQAGTSEDLTAGGDPAGRPADSGYDFSAPSARHPLPDELKEVSSVAPLGGTKLVVNEDNRGRVYVLDAQSGKVLNEVKFGKKGDFEEVEPVGGALYVLRSDGTLFALQSGWESGNEQVDEYELDLPKGCDAEGLAYHTGSHRLLVSCKEDPGKGIKDARAIYAYDIEAGKVGEEPEFVIPFDEIARVAGIDEKDAEDFKPSAMAFHPVTGDLYVLSSVLKVIVVLGPSGEILRVDKLDGDLLEQPEGIGFLPNGDMLISSEGQKRPAMLVSYTFTG